MNKQTHYVQGDLIKEEWRKSAQVFQPTLCIPQKPFLEPLILKKFLTRFHTAREPLYMPEMVLKVFFVMCLGWKYSCLIFAQPHSWAVHINRTEHIAKLEHAQLFKLLQLPRTPKYERDFFLEILRKTHLYCMRTNVWYIKVCYHKDSMFFS